MTKQISMVLGIVLTIVGLWGYFSGGVVLGVFAVDGLHNTIHLVSGVIGIMAARRGETYAQKYLKFFGVIYALVFLLGLFPSGGRILGLIVTNTADNILHLVIALLALYGGFSKAKGAPSSSGMPAPI